MEAQPAYVIRAEQIVHQAVSTERAVRWAKWASAEDPGRLYFVARPYTDQQRCCCGWTIVQAWQAGHRKMHAMKAAA